MTANWLEIEAFCRRELGTFVTTQLVTIIVKQVEEDWLVETNTLVIVVADTLIIGTLQRIEVVAEVTAATCNGDGEELKVFEQESSFKQESSLCGRQLVQFLPAFTQAQFLHEAALLHLQHTSILLPHPPFKSCV